MPSTVATPPAADAGLALAHFSSRLSFETDCWDVHHAICTGSQDFVLLDVRGVGRYAERHVPGAINIPHAEITAARLSQWPADTLFVVYCAGPHCNGAVRAALALAALERPVKEMLGGISGWADEGLPFDSALSEAL